jgi:uncharacterized protein YybS (DUF2232 family)
VAAGRFTLWLLGLACLGLLLLAGRLHPFAYLAVGTWLPLPLVVVGWRLGERAALSLAAMGALLVWASQPTVEGVLNNLAFGELLLMGVLLSSCRRRGVLPAHGIFLATAALAFAGLLILLAQAGLAGQSPLEVLQHKARETAQTLNKVFAETGIETNSLLMPGFPQLDWETLISRVYPALFVINTAFVAWLNTVAARSLAHHLKWDEPGLPLSEWNNPEWLIFVFLIAGFLLLIPVPSLRLISLNLLLIMGFVYFCQGVAVVATIFQRFRVPLVLRLLGYPLLFMNPLFFLIILLGLTDIWLDFRRLHQPRDA